MVVGVVGVVLTLAPVAVGMPVVAVAAVMGFFAALAKVELHTAAAGAVVAIVCGGHHHSLRLDFLPGNNARSTICELQLDRTVGGRPHRQENPVSIIARSLI